MSVHPFAQHAALVELSRGLSAALAVDWDNVDLDQLPAQAELALHIHTRCEALVAKVAGAVDRSGVWAEHHGTPKALLAKLVPNRRREALGMAVRHGARLRQMPVTRAAFEGGEITTDHVRLLATLLHSRFEGRFLVDESVLVGHAKRLAWVDFVRVVTRWKDAADRSEPDVRDEQDLDAREVHLARSFHDRGVLNGTLTPLARNIFGAELDCLVDLLFAEDWNAAVERLGEGSVSVADLGRTGAQRRHDALVLMAKRSAVAGKDPKLLSPALFVHCTEADLQAAFEADAGGEPVPVPFEVSMCELEDGTQISHRMLVRLAVQAEVRRVVLGPKGEILDFGKRARFFTKIQREALAVRDRVCACGCALSARRCEADHVTEVRDGGRTDLVNGQPLCGSAHRKKTNNRTKAGPPKGPTDPPQLILRT
jgi:hypothetical protein